MFKYYIPINVRIHINPIWVRKQAIVPSKDLFELVHLWKPHLLPIKLAAVSPTPTVKIPLSKINNERLLVGIQSGKDKPQNKYKGVKEIKLSFSSANTENPCCNIFPRGGICKYLIN